MVVGALHERWHGADRRSRTRSAVACFAASPRYLPLVPRLSGSPRPGRGRCLRARRSRHLASSGVDVALGCHSAASVRSLSTARAARVRLIPEVASPSRAGHPPAFCDVRYRNPRSPFTPQRRNPCAAHHPCFFSIFRSWAKCHERSDYPTAGHVAGAPRRRRGPCGAPLDLRYLWRFAGRQRPPS